MSLKQKLFRFITVYPNLVTMGIGLTIAFGIGLVMGIIEIQQGFAAASGGSAAAAAHH